MLKFSISCSSSVSHFLQIELTFHLEKNSETTLFLPSWRPGRYEIADYAKNLRGLKAIGDGNALNITKITKNKWIVDTQNIQELTIQYDYYAFEMTAGTSWVDDEQWYVNFINCMLWPEGMQNTPVEVLLNLPPNYHVGCALPFNNGVLKALNYQELVDSPLFASKNLQHFSFEAHDCLFHLWIQGAIKFDIKNFITDIKKYTTAQVELFGEFPTSNYHYLFQFLPYKYYHGVEHKNSTVITIGPDEALTKRTLYKELLGVSSHELFHTWNVTRIRPKEMLPYDFSEETFTKTGLITEGLTTYYGDLMLYRAGVFSEEEYLNELSKMLQRHLMNTGRHHSSLVESSHDLWLDGYKLSAPGGKVSIYVKGALIAWILDLKLQQKGKSLDDVMLELWQQFGNQKNGYTLDDYKQIIHHYLGEGAEAYIQNYIYGITPVEEELTSLLKDTPYNLAWEENDNPIERTLGFKLDSKDKVAYTDPESDAFEKLSVKDKIISINGNSPESYRGNEDTVVEIDRFGRGISMNLKKGNYMKLPILRTSIS